MTTIEDSQDKIIERLGDCNKVPVDYMDLLSHRVRCRKIEIFHYEEEVSFTPNEIEEEQELTLGQQYSEDHTDDEDRARQLAGGLDCLIRRIELMQLAIRQRKQDDDQQYMSFTNIDEEDSTATQEPQLGVMDFKQCRPVKEKKILGPHEEQLAARPLPMTDQYKNPLSCDEKLAISNLQHAQHRMQCEIDEVICNYRKLRRILNGMRGHICQDNRELRQLAVLTNQHQAWSNLVAKELHVCKERYSQQRAGKLSTSEAKSTIITLTAKTSRFAQAFLSKRQLWHEIREFQVEIELLKSLAHDICQEMQLRFDSARRAKELPIK